MYLLVCPQLYNVSIFFILKKLSSLRILILTDFVIKQCCEYVQLLVMGGKLISNFHFSKKVEKGIMTSVVWFAW